MGVDEDHLAMPRVSAFNAVVQNTEQESSWGLRELAGGRGGRQKGATREKKERLMNGVWFMVFFN